MNTNSKLTTLLKNSTQASIFILFISKLDVAFSTLADNKNGVNAIKTKLMKEKNVYGDSCV